MEQSKQITQNLSESLLVNVIENIAHYMNVFSIEKNNFKKMFIFPKTIVLLEDCLLHSRIIETLFLYKKEGSKEWSCSYKKRFSEEIIPEFPSGKYFQIKIPHAPFWTHVHEKQLVAIEEKFKVTENEAMFFDALIELAFDYGNVIEQGLQRKLSIVCGPISTGPGTKKQKLITFKKGIYLLENNPGKNSLILNQMPFEDIFDNYHHWANARKKENQIISVFYEKLFESGMLDKSYMLPCWADSDGASWEYWKSQKLGFSIVDIEKDKPIMLENFWKQFYDFNRHEIYF